MSLLDLVGSPMQITAPESIPDRYRQGYEDFYNQNPNDYQRIGGAAVSYVTTPQGERIQFGDTGGASNFRRYLESIGESPIPDQFSAIGLQPAMPPGMEDGGGPQLFPNKINEIDQLRTERTPGPIFGVGDGIHSILPRRIQLPPGDGGFGRAVPLPDLTRRGPMPMPMPGPYRPGPILGQPLLPKVPDYSSQFEKFGEQLTGFGDQMTGYQDALGSFNEQVGGMGKQFETISNRLDSVDKGLGSLGNQIASLENMQQAQPQQVMQPQRPTFNPFGFGGFGGFGGLGSLFGRRY